jgi:RNA polymerase sigma-70 factor (ECF subfamily)
VAFLVLLEQLSPLERAVFLLREVFDHDYAEIATIVERTPEACRQLFARARQHLAANRPRFPPTRDQHRELVVRFGQCVMGGDLTGLVDLLASDVVLEADSNGRVRGALLAPMRGRDAVATFVLRTPNLPGGPYRTEVATVNGEPALLLFGAGGEARGVVTLEVDAGKVRAIRVIANPEKLSRLPAGAS